MDADTTLTADEQSLFDRLGPIFEQERLRMAKALAAKPDSELFGKNEFEMRERVHELGAKVLEEAANERQKKGAGTSEPAVLVRTVTPTPSSSNIVPRASRVCWDASN